MNELFIEAKLENMDAVLDFVHQQLGEKPSKIKNKILIVVDEIFSNIARYAYQPESGSVTVRITVEDDICIEFEDGGIAYNPLDAEIPEITLSAEEREIGGLGIFMVKNIMDSITYRRDGNKNILTVKKNLRDQ